jgi:hypothetical protein
MRKQITFKNLSQKMIYFLSFCIFCSTFYLKGQSPIKGNHYGSQDVKLFDGKIYNLSGFKNFKKHNISKQILDIVDPAYHNHPDFGIATHEVYKDAIELVDKRTANNTMYLMTDGKVISTGSSEPINYIDRNGNIRNIRYTLDASPHGGSTYKASQQPLPKTIDLNTGKTGFESSIGNFYINQNTKVRFFNGNTEIGHAFELNMSSKEIGDNGLFVKNAFPDMDMQVILMDNGFVKTNYIIKNRNVINLEAEYMVFEDILTLPRSLNFDFETNMGIHNGNFNDWDGSLVFRDQSGNNVFNYYPPFIYDDRYTEELMTIAGPTYNSIEDAWQMSAVSNTEASTYASYRVEKIDDLTYKISVIVKTSWLLASERVFPIVIDPVTFPGNALVWNPSTHCSRKISGTTPSDNPGPTGVGCYNSTTLLPAGYMLITSQPTRVNAGYKTRSCAANNTFMKFYGPCGVYPNQAGFFYFCNTTQQNVDCNGNNIAMDGIVSRCNITAGEPCATPTPPSCSNQTITFGVCYQTRSCAGGTTNGCYKTSTTDAAQYVEPGLQNFKVDVIGEKITTTLSGSPTSGSNVCPNTNVPLTLTTKWGVPKNLSTSNCTDQMGGTYSWTATCTGGTLSATSGITSTTGGFATATTWNSGTTPGTYTITVTVCNTDCNSPSSVMCDVRTLTYTVGNAIPPVVSDVEVCNNITANPLVSSPLGGYTYTWYNNATGTVINGTGTTRPYAPVNGTTQTYSVRATSPCASDLITFTITWGPLEDPIGSSAAACPGDLATLTANCGGNCRWYTSSTGGTPLTTSAPITIGTGSLTVDPVSTSVTFYVENYVSSGCISNRTPLTINTNGLIVTTNPSLFDPLCLPSTAQFTSTVSGNNDVKLVTSSTSSPAETINQFISPACSGADCNTSNSGQQTLTTPLAVSNPMTNISVQSVCFSITAPATGRWCGKGYRFYLTSPSGTTFTLYAGRAKNNKNDQGDVNLCFNDLASDVIFAPSGGAGVNISSGSYLADGGSLQNAFIGETPVGTWTLNIVDIESGGGTCGDGTPQLSNFTMTFGYLQLPTYSWSGSVGTVSSSTISNPLYTPPSGSYNDTWTVTVTDAKGCTGSATVGVICTTLPVELLSFYGEVGERNNNLFWKTASEENSDYIEIQRSSNGVDFYEIGKVKAANNSNSLLNYDFIDTKRMKGINYYRLKMIDFDGQFEYSKIISLETKDDNISLELIPNPATSMIDIKFNMNFEAETDIKIYDSRGSIVKHVKHDSKKGTNSYVVDLENYSKGIYSVVINNDGIISTSRFVKQ